MKTKFTEFKAAVATTSSGCQSDAIESAMNAPPQAAARSSSASASVTRRNAALSGLTEMTGRVLLALLFLFSGVGKARRVQRDVP
jgi:hypothetical protein